MALRPTTCLEANVQQPSQKLGKVGILLGVLGLVLVLVLAPIGCSRGSASDEFDTIEHPSETDSYLAPDDTYDKVSSGLRLVLSYDSTANAFQGTMENITRKTRYGVNVEVRFSNGIKLGPTTSLDLAPSQVIKVTLPVGSASLTTWDVYISLVAS